MCDVEFVPGTTTPKVQAATMGRLKVFMKLTFPRKIMSDRNKSNWQMNMAIASNAVTMSIAATLEKTSVWEAPLVNRGYAIKSRWEAFRYLLPKFLRKGRVKLTPIMVPAEIHYIHGGNVGT